ncbi:MBL fold metallo-hydrolase [Kibdelosporangium phytohabitans]|uniref:MBL fold metallo-hydrolase n=1 Tax=Kibdelosporangium phytohabitans TaxID=860235 RepID=A0A0N9IAI6_9PSEU|nr:MBL fold metallo-hydrolase [Kibdelosporangium phytohabitans]ALG13386.1 MBL fold metallo-hydrolase [Kibdelosporangium phytohabitans]MBE1465181.1 glyoxylase-like metal-dependent hydrolase (beta-lactamase superfamily II) [Kibdelosporangium phytohabitans]
MTFSTDLPICRACGLQYAAPRPDCPVCEDERQYVARQGQSWTTLAELWESGRTAKYVAEGPDVLGVGCDPGFAIGQRALLIQRPGGNVLWDCVTYVDDAMVEQVRSHGDVAAIAISHPHYYSTMVDWAHALDVPVYLHENDRQWVPRPDGSIVFWDGDSKDLGNGLTLLNLGVHFAGGTVLHDRDARALFTGDILQVTPGRDWVSFMYSYPNYIPERPSVVRRALDLLEPYDYDSIYGAWWDFVVKSGAKDVVARSAERYLRHAEDRA